MIVLAISVIAQYTDATETVSLASRISHPQGVTTTNATVTDTLAITLTLDGVDVQMKVELFGLVVPNTVANFKALCLNNNTVYTLQDGAKARNYNDAIFYKIVEGFFGKIHFKVQIFTYYHF